MERRYLTDMQLAEYLNVCKVTARKYAKDVGAVVYIGKSRRNDKHIIDKTLHKEGEWLNECSANKY